MTWGPLLVAHGANESLGKARQTVATLRGRGWLRVFPGRHGVRGVANRAAIVDEVGAWAGDRGQRP